MKHIGIVCPLWAEAQPILKWHCDPNGYKYNKQSWVELVWNECQIVMVISKIGKANAVKATKTLIEKFSPQLVVNFGSAGAIAPHVSIGEAVISSKTTEYKESSSNAKWFPISSDLISIAKSIEGIQIGPIVSADQNIESETLKRYLFNSYQALCGDWESAVVMRVCSEYQVPSLAFRVITDLGDVNAMSDFKKHHQDVLTQAGSLLQQYLMLWNTMH